MKPGFVRQSEGRGDSSRSDERGVMEDVLCVSVLRGSESSLSTKLPECCISNTLRRKFIFPPCLTTVARVHNFSLIKPLQLFSFSFCGNAA